MKLVIVVTGGRDYANRGRVEQEILSRNPALVIHGACPRGADELADIVCRERGIGCQRFPADWDAHGRAAGPIRNRQMMLYAQRYVTPQESEVLVLAFPGGRGTANAKREARAAGLPIEEIS